MTGLHHDDPFRRHNMAVLDDDESALQPKSQPLFYCLSHGGRGLPSPKHNHTLIATQVIPTPADDQLLAVSRDGATDRLPGIDCIQASNNEFLQKWTDRRGRQAEVEVTVERRPDVLHLSLGLNLNLPITPTMG
jgi:hypothetical protein